MILVLIGLWLAVLVNDLRQRRVPIPLLLALLVVSLIGHTWLWWFLALALIVTPRRWTISLAPIALAVGWFTGDPAPALAIALGCVAWALRWWGGVDSIALVTLGLRCGGWGLIGGAVATMLMGVVVMIKRRRSLTILKFVMIETLRLQPRAADEIPADAELPAAAALAGAGMVLGVAQLIQLILPTEMR